MKDERLSSAQSVPDALLAQASATKRQRISLVILLLSIAGFILIVINGNRLHAATAMPQPAQGADQDYSNFSHQSQRHASLECAACHHRSADNSTRPRLPGHKACTGCHLAQFVTSNIPLCFICHTDVKSTDAPLKAFPAHFNESFNLKFDHAQHMNGEARPQQGCVFCHDRPLHKGVALNIPAGLPAHNQCYTCHTPNRRTPAGLDISSCGICHANGAYIRTRTTARAFSASFSHAEHSARQRLGCADCHSLTPGLPQSKQVSLPRTAEHFHVAREMSCQGCHNGKRAFGESDFGDCRRCHKGQTFRMPV